MELAQKIVYMAIYVGDEFPDYIGYEVQVKDDWSDPMAPCYTMILEGDEFGNMHDEDFEFID